MLSLQSLLYSCVLSSFPLKLAVVKGAVSVADLPKRQVRASSLSLAIYCFYLLILWFFKIVKFKPFNNHINTRRKVCVWFFHNIIIYKFFGLSRGYQASYKFICFRAHNRNYSLRSKNSSLSLYDDQSPFGLNSVIVPNAYILNHSL